MLDTIQNFNDHFTSNAIHNTYRGDTSLKQGKIVNVTRENHLAQVYDVEELETGALIKSCRYLSSRGGFNGVGSYAALDEGTPVTITSVNGTWDDTYITGVFYTEGNYKKYYEEGKLQEFAELEEFSNKLYEFNQPSGHPNRVTDPGATINLYGVNNLYSDFSSPEFTDNLEDKAKSNKQPGAIDLVTSVGDKVNYAFNSIINYTSNIINVAEGTAESKCAKLLDFANYYNKQADLLEQTSLIKETTKEEAKKTTGLKPIVTKESTAKSKGSLSSPFTNKYFIEQYRKLAQSHIEQAQACNRGDAARQLVGLQMQANSSSELPQSNTTQGLEDQQTKPNYTPKEEKADVAKTNYGTRTQLGFKPLIVLHETIGNAASVKSLFATPNLKASVSYHVMITLDGTLVYFTDPKNRAFGASPSQFRGEYEERVRDDGKKVKSVNSFAYHISFESPLSGQGNNENNTTHSGYTEAQYNSLGWLTAKTGVPFERITTHKEVNIVRPEVSPNIDPRSFDKVKFQKIWNSYPKTKEIFFGINGEEDWIKNVTNTKIVNVKSEETIKNQSNLTAYPVINEAGNTVFTINTNKVFNPSTLSSGNVITNLNDLKFQVSEVLNYFNNVSDSKVNRKGLLNLNISKVQETLRKIQSINNISLNNLSSNFDFYKWTPYNPSNNSQNKVRITKYAVFTHTASKVKTSTYNVGIYQLKPEYTRYTKYTKQQVLTGIYESGGIESDNVNIIGYTTLADLNEMLLEGSGYVKFTDGEEVYVNVTKNNGIAYDKKKTPAAQSRYWYFQKVNSPKGYGNDITTKINIRPNVCFAGDYLNVGFGKLILIESNDNLRLATIGDTGGAFLPSLYQLDYFAGTFATRNAYNNFVADLPSEANAYVLVSK